ncbi:helix-turn-helix domain-containing protein [Neobacillus jeddahensis]|uniref:helix-turn-helix domain-containing protein n=1 Tax=Neobacillus jeddahensis TaxID=1461580 RepID=UPI00059059A6|nr:RodZ domain-containing protein [Neobacillus jeddahensis]
MTELGNQLKEARLAKELSLDDVQTMTKIQKRYLIGIEEGDYSSMPGNFYVRAFIKQYAEALDLNPDEIFETYKSEIPASYNEDLPQQLSRVKTHKTITEGNSKIFDILPKVLIVVFIIGVAGLLYYFLAHHLDGDATESVNKDSEQVNFEKSDNLKNVKADEKKTETDKKNDSDKVIEDTKKDEEKTPPADEVPKQELTAIQSSGNSSTYDLKNADKFVVKLVSKGQTWVSIKNGKGKTFFTGTLKVGATESQTQDLSAESTAVIRVGNAADTEIYVNDQKLEYAIPATANVQNITIQYVLKTE